MKIKVSLLIKLIYGTDVTNHALTEKVDNFLTKFKFNNFKIYIRCKITLKYHFKICEIKKLQEDFVG